MKSIILSNLFSELRSTSTVNQEEWRNILKKISRFEFHIMFVSTMIDLISVIFITGKHYHEILVHLITGAQISGVSHMRQSHEISYFLRLFLSALIFQKESLWYSEYWPYGIPCSFVYFIPKVTDISIISMLVFLLKIYMLSKILSECHK